MSVIVPDVTGLGRVQAEAKLDNLKLRHIARFPFGANADGSATEQHPGAGTSVPLYSLIIVSYPSHLGPMDDSPIEGPILNGSFEGRIDRVVVDQDGASIDFTSTQGRKRKGKAVKKAVTSTLRINLYVDKAISLLARSDWMRRGAMLSLAQRAFTNADRVHIVVADGIALSLELHKP